ncbi:MAG: hypothetical protein AABY11_03095, partial [archaeon]
MSVLEEHVMDGGKIGLIIFGAVFVIGLLGWYTPPSSDVPVWADGLRPVVVPSSLSSVTPNFVSDSSIGFTDLEHNSIPTKMSLQGKVTDFNGNLVDDANLGVKIGDASSCSTNIFYDYTFP